ncbi:MAG: PilZ domain-containing protein [Treponema sp.]|nr:PilZ domain-containing protein [Treponema sp.]
MAAFVLIIIIAFLCIVLFYRSGGEKTNANWILFFKRGKEAGFSIRELEQIRRLVVNCNIEEPETIFSSQKHLETCIRSVVNAVRMSGDSEDPGIQDFLSRLFDYCKQLGIKNSEKQSVITNSRQISEGQALKILVPGTGVFKSEVIKNFGNYLTISRPVNQKMTSHMQWDGLRISVYFWREDDAGYVFDTEVTDEVFSKGISSLKVEHNDSLFRTQKRTSLRVKLKKAAFVYLVNDTDPHKMEKSPGLRCMMEDISDTGCAFRVTGMAPVGYRLKVQFSLDRIPICMPGTIRSVDYLHDANISVIHMEADPLPLATRNHILCEVFDMLPDEDEDELPFRVIEDETDKTSAPSPAEDAQVRKFQEVING